MRKVECFKDGKKRVVDFVNYKNHLEKAGWSLEKPKEKSKGTGNDQRKSKPAGSKES